MPLVPLIVYVPRVLLSTELFNNKLLAHWQRSVPELKIMKGINFYHLSFYAHRAFEGIKVGDFNI
jgi:mitochondrial fission protein ELM1